MQLTEADKKHIRHIDFIQLTDRIIVTSFFVALGTGIALALDVLLSTQLTIPSLVFWALAGTQLVSWGVSYGVAGYADRKIQKYK